MPALLALSPAHTHDTLHIIRKEKMNIRKEIIDHEFYLYFNGKLIYKKWFDLGYSKVFDRGAWDKYTSYSITDFDLEETPPFFEIKSNLKLIETINGGRKTSIQNGYRPDHVFEYEKSGIIKYAFIGDIQLGSLKELNPGEQAKVSVRFLTHQPIEQYLKIGNKWWIHEGPIKIGTGEILDINFPTNK